MFFRFFITLLLIGGVAALLGWSDYKAFLDSPLNLVDIKADTMSDNTAPVFAVEKGWSAKRVGRELASKNIIEREHWFYLNARLEKKAALIKTGEYELKPDMTGADLLSLFVEGKSKQYTFSVIEGHSFKQLMASLAGAENLQAPDVQMNGEQVMQALGKPELHAEGQFFADTYNFPRNSSVLDFLRRANQALDKVLQEEWEARADGLPYKTPYEALIMASIIEKETAVASERPKIAGVFVSRLGLKMRLQTDPTVIYGIGDSYDGNIRRSDLRRDTPYNTYTRGGLPPTPISMVGREAIHAALNPESTTALYFVSRGDGTHKFSDNVDQHNEAVRKYQLKKRSNK